MRTIDKQRIIWKYLHGNLTIYEADRMWALFIKEPEWYDYFVMEAALITLLSDE